MLFGLLLLVPFGFGVWYAFLHGWWLNFIVPSGTLVANVGFVAMYRALVEEKEKRRVRGAFQQYLSPEVIRRLLENPDLVKPRKTEITVMFSDVRGFTTHFGKTRRAGTRRAAQRISDGNDADRLPPQRHAR